MVPRPYLAPAIAIALGVLAGCGDDDGTSGTVDAGPTDGGAADAAVPTFEPRGCPGGPGCADEGDGVLHVGAAAIEITADVAAADVLDTDVDGDGHYDPSDGDTFVDRDENGKFDGVWIAGFSNGRPASGVNDPQWARAIALRQNQTTVVIVSVDAISLFKDDVDRARERVADLDVDYVAVMATHSHQVPDTLGIWGVTEGVPGVDPDYLERVLAGVAQAVRDAVADLRPAHVQYASFQFRDQPGGMTRYVSDNRDPYIVDDRAVILRFRDASPAADVTIATLINFGSHPEYGGGANTLLSSDYVHALRQGVEMGVDGPMGMHRDGVGGIAVFVNGPLGVQIGPQKLRAETWDGTYLGEMHSLELARVVGEQMAWFVLGALGEGGGSITEETARVAFRARETFVDVENRGFHVAILAEVFTPRATYNWNPDRPLVPGRNEPDIKTEVAIVDVGRVQFLLFPGELDPALLVGGYDGSFTPEGVAIVDTTATNPPDLTMAPEPPYLRDLGRADADHVVAFNLANDMLGYLVPSFDYELDPESPYFDEAPGSHYEEQVSTGPNGWPTIERTMIELLAWTPGM